ncbi:MAG: CGNR zinc finger domain-containing protein [Dehalococcoidia bacterium]
MTSLSIPADSGAPGGLRLIQDFLNTPRIEPTPAELAMAAEVRSEGELGVPQATLAARHGISQQLVSAILRRKRLMPAQGGGFALPSSLGTPESAQAALVALGFMDADQPLSPTEHGVILELHRLLLAMALANNTGASAEDEARDLTRLAEAATLTVTFDSNAGSSLRPVSRGANGAIAAILAIVHGAMHDGTWSRLKVCPADRCEAAFYDTSRNRSATWCSMAICGNRAKVSSYQQRRRGARRP